MRCSPHYQLKHIQILYSTQNKYNACYFTTFSKFHFLLPYLVYIFTLLTSALLTRAVLAGCRAAVMFPEGHGACLGRAQTDARLHTLVSWTEGLGNSSSAPAESPAVPGAQLTPTTPQISFGLIVFSLR